MDTMLNSAQRAMGPVAALHSAALHGRSYLDCFSDSERRQILGTRNLQRRQERLAGRLAAKFLFLNQHCGANLNSLPALAHLTPAHLDRFTAADYRSAEVFRSEEVCAGMPQIGGQSIAITHKSGLSCAFLGISVDMESVEPRTPAFYSGNFTPLERSWVADAADRLKLDPQWTFTFLWTVKECMLKTYWFGDLSLADLPSMQVRIAANEDQLVYPHFAPEFLPRFVFLQTEVADRRRTVQADLAVSGQQDLILTAVTAVQRRIA
jgi:hypothetical protein